MLFVVSCFVIKDSENTEYQLVSYLDIPVDSMGNLPKNPYVIDLSHREKRLVVLGTQHSFDSLNPMYESMERIFYNVLPDILINEGGDLHKSYTSLGQAITEDSDLGFDKYLADKLGIETVNGDEPQRLEFMELADAFSREEAIMFYGTERLLLPYVFGEYAGDLDHLYERKFIYNLMHYDDIKLSPEEQTFVYYQQGFEKFFGGRIDWNNFDEVRNNINQLDFIPFGNQHHFNTVARKSKELRDIYLLRTIEEQLKLHDTVMVVYGGWHVLAIEPSLTTIIANTH